MASLARAIPELDAKGLRHFGVTTGIVVAALFGLFFPWLLERPVPVWPWVLASVLVLWGLLAPATLRPVYRGWMHFGLMMSRITAPIILGLVFFVVITPVALIKRLLGKDDMARKRDASAPSYRVPSSKQKKDHLEKPF